MSRPADLDVPDDVLAWIRADLQLVPLASAQALYDRMESQSARSLPILYVPFDPRQRSHVVDRGHILDYAASVGRGRVLDFGPGDGWPSLLLARFVDEVVGVDGSARRVAVCEENARRLGVRNARFVQVPPGHPLPFPDASFDAVVAASSVEQTPDPRTTLAELRRVLRPGGVLRIAYESLGRYRGRREREVEAVAGGLLAYDRDVPGETVRHYFVEEPVARARLALTWTTQQPSGPTLVRWLREAAFSRVAPTQEGGRAAGMLFDALPPERRPQDLEETDRLLRPAVGAAVATAAPADSDPMLTAVR